MIFEIDTECMARIITTIAFMIIVGKIIFMIVSFIISPILHLGKRSRKKEQEQQFQNLMNQQQFQQFIQEQQFQQFMDEDVQRSIQWSVDEGMKSVTPFEHGGYDMNNGNSFNNPF